MKSKISLSLVVLFLLVSCNKKKDDNSSSLALLALLSSSSTSFSTTCTTTFGTGVPDWIKNSFTCVTVSVSGSNYVFKTTSIPTYKSIYWGTSSSGYEATMYVNTATTANPTNKANPNSIKSQNITITVPSDPTTSGAPATGFGAIGVAANGIVIYNDQAAPGDSLSTEYYTFDTQQGHPTNTGAYHYHVDPIKITTGNDAAFVGVALDGYPIFGKKHDTTATANSAFSLGGTSSTTACTFAATTIPSTWTQATNYTTARTTAGNARHYHVNSGSEVLGIILSGKYIGTAGTSL